MASLAATSLQRLGVEIVVANRTPDRAQRLAESLGGEAVSLDALVDALTGVDLAIACTGALGHLITESQVAAAQQARGQAPMMLIDLALPRDIDPAVLGIHGVTLIDLEDLGELLSDAAYEHDVEGVRRIVAHEVETYLDARHADRVTPTVVALRSRASEIVSGELDRFDARQAVLDPTLRADVELLVNRIVDKLLHAPTVRVRELAGEPDGDTYADALHRLFDLDPRVVEAVVKPDPDEGAR